ncbi:Type I inositol 1,4,5-trisphosphate 5-phosphatase CVP2 [Apostasia shenzhenica]|uniref:Type I inositol 1,4,5-trisphosphate 5-phosphatase CVP2 n=1 Tax=Apostasia shenzhenica TaxID=1088818 RepID=A0A2I0BE52_9ASPA|nr:Type I inositol 1,4,5-trisphosphate 5-phosphatase CVP2 [Apostasia shenzhenica]
MKESRYCGKAGSGSSGGPGLRPWSENGSTSGANPKVFMLMILVGQVIRLNLECGWKITSKLHESRGLAALLSSCRHLCIGEIVPLNAGNVLGAEDNGPARRWVSLIRKTLNNLPGAGGYGSYHTPSPAANLIPEFDDDFGAKNSSFFHRHSFQALRRSRRMDDGDVVVPPPAVLDRRFSVCDRVIFGGRLSDFDANFRWGRSSDDENIGLESPTTVVFSPASYGYGAPTGLEGRERSSGRCRYSLIASKQMVGIFLTVWAGSETRDCVRNLKISCVGRGLMGYLGNKGSISISMSLHHTTFCFVCGHLTSGEKDGDELRRNADVMEILRKTRFPRVSHNKEGCEKSPETILEHDRIIWLGDLNYRIALSYRAAKALVEMQNWKVLLEKDQLRIEQRSGRVFTGWNEGTIYFPPTYKYSNNSDRYAVDDINPKEKRRTPAWCDRILWQGRGLHQLSYVRGESRFSDHRPVSSVFDVEVELMSRNRLSRNTNSASSRVEVEELLPYSKVFTKLSFY